MRGGLDEETRAEVRVLLTASQRALFFGMAPAYQRHCFRVYKKLAAAGCQDVEALRAALLHDVGKGQLGLPYRVAVVGMSFVWPALLRKLSAECRPSSWRRPFSVAAGHADLGACQLLQAGCEPRLVEIVRRHHAPGVDEGWLKALQEADADS